MRLELARLNHILIPKNKEDRDRLRASRVGRALEPIARLLGSLTEEGRVLATVTLLVGAFGLDVRGTMVFVLFSVFAGLLLGSLVAARLMRLGGACLTVSAPRRVTVGEPITFVVRCASGDSDRPFAHVRVRGPFLPWDGAWLDRPPRELVVPARGHAELAMRARFTTRGLHHLDPFQCAQAAPLSLAVGPRVESAPVKIHVVPRVARVTRLPRALSARHQPGGVALASKSGESMDLLGVRPYRPGDPVRDLHARSWARAGVPVVREYQQEYFTRVGVVLSTSTRDAERLEAAVELTAGVVAGLARGECLIDVIVTGDRAHVLAGARTRCSAGHRPFGPHGPPRIHDLTLGRSLGTLDQALELLAAVAPGPAVTPAQLLGQLSPYLDRLSVVYVIALPSEGDGDALSRALRERGLACETVLVTDELARAVRAGEPIAL